MSEHMKIGSLFSGYGGLDLAVEAVTGATPAWFCEWDEAPANVLAHHWPDVPNHRDVTTINWAQVEPVDIITGGSPCQDLSQAGKRAGMTEGTRSNLWVNMREAIATLQPRLVVWENVLGALSAQAESESDNATISHMEQGGGLLAAPRGGHLRALGRVLGDLTEIGYDAEWTTLRASDIGAPHHRARVFLIAWPRVLNPGHDAGRAQHGQQHETPAGGTGQPSADAPHPESVGWGIWAPENHREANRESTAPTNHRDTTSDTGGIGLQAGRPPGGAETQLAESNYSECSLSNSERERWGRRGSAAPEGKESWRAPGVLDGCSSRIEWGRYAPAIRRWERALGTPAPNPTELNSKGKPRLAAPFAEWMMGLPAGWVTAPEIGLTRSQQLKALGNGVVPQQAQAAITHLLERS